MRALVLAAVVTAATGAQKPPAVRAIGRAERVSTDSLASVSSALPMPGGRVLVNDITSRRVLLFDSTLAHATVVADTTSATGNAYGTRPGTLIALRRDTALFIDQTSLSMLVIGPTGAIVRVMAIPRPDDAQMLIGSVFGMPGFDARGRMISYGNPGRGGGSGTMILAGRPKISLMPGGAPITTLDSAYIARVDLPTRAVDTIAWIKIPRVKRTFGLDADSVVTSITTTYYPVPIVDDWAVTSDGSVAIVRGRDYHVDWLGADGRWMATPKMPFDWTHLDDDRKRTLIDSAVKAEQADLDGILALARTGASAGGGRGGGGRGGGAPPGGVSAGGGGGRVPNLVGVPGVSEIADYEPPFAHGSTMPDADGNVWIRTSVKLNGQPVYDIVNRRGELIDRVQLPTFRTIAGFGPGVVYMGVKDAAGVVHIERARVK